MTLKTVMCPEFREYGKVIQGINFNDMLGKLKSVPIPETVEYLPSVEVLEECRSGKICQKNFYGDMEIQVGRCSGNNHILEALEYHRDSEINVAACDLILLLGRRQDMKDDYTFETGQVKAFLLPAGVAVELYATTLHYAPCNAGPGFHCVVVLPKGTNLPLKEKVIRTKEDELLTAKNKWVIAGDQCNDPGVFHGLVGKDICLSLAIS